MNSPVSLKSALLWWFGFSVVWGIYRLFPMPEFLSEVIAKPVVWLGSIVIIWKTGILPKAVVNDLRLNYLLVKPVLMKVVAPVLFTLFYFALINWRIMQIPDLNLQLIGYTMVVNFMTGIVEEITYRGILYVWLKKLLGLPISFLLTQILFFLGHLPILVLYSESVSAALSHAFFIVLLSCIYTAIFEITKSLYASSISHGLWNSMVYYLLLT